MKLYATITSERASKAQGKGAQEFIEMDLTVHRQNVGRIELQYKNDRADGYDADEWVLMYWKDEESDGDIIAQGNIVPPKEGK